MGNTHTPGPWKALQGTYENGNQVKVVPVDHNISSYIMIGGDNNKANAHHIVKCVNSHDELLEACKGIMDSFCWVAPTNGFCERTHRKDSQHGR